MLAVLPLILSVAPLQPSVVERSVCQLDIEETSGVRSIELELIGLRWEDWPSHCERLIAFLRDGDGFPAAARVAQRFDRTGAFDRATCHHPEPGRLHCQLAARAVVRDIEVRGSLPFPLRRSVVKSRLGVALGTRIGDLREDEVTSRVHRYLERNGFYGAEVRIATEATGGAEPAVGYRLVVEITGAVARVLGRVQITGDPIITAEEAEEVLRHHWLPGLLPQRVRLEQVREDVEEIAEALRARGWPAVRLRVRQEIDPVSGEVDLVLDVRAGPELATRFVGNRSVATDDLREVLPFVEARKVDRSTIQAARDRMREALQREGFYRAEVIVDEDRSARDRLVLTFRVQEGPRAELTRIEVTGNGPEILGEVELRSSASSCVTTGRWVDEDVEHDRIRIEEYLRGVGFSHAVVRAEQWHPAPGEIGLRFAVSTADRRIVAAVVVEGLPGALDVDEAIEAVGLPTGAPIDGPGREESVRKLRAWLMMRGHPEADIVSHTRNTRGEKVDLVLTVSPGERLVFGGSLFSGNYETSDWLLRADLDPEPGDPLGLDEIVAFKRRLRERGLFDGVKVTAIEGRATRRWLLTEVQEADLVTLDALLGFSTDDLFSIGAELEHGNLFGLGLRLDASVSLSNSAGLGAEWLRIGNRDRASVGLAAPRAFGLPFNLALNGSCEHENKPAFEETEGGGALAISRVFSASETCRWCPTLGLSLSYGVKAVLARLDDVKDAPEPEFVVVPRLIPKLVVSQLDSVTDPRRGYSLTTQLELGHTLGNNESAGLWRYFATLTTYIAIGDPVVAHVLPGSASTARWVVAWRGTVGFAEPFAPSTVLPISEALCYGGDHSVRGLPERVSQQLSPDGRHLLAASVELRWYFWDDLWIGDLQLAAFCDLGAVSGPGERLFQHASLSVGPVLRYATVIGPLAVGYGIPVLRPAGGESLIPAEGRMYVTFGAAF